MIVVFLASVVITHAFIDWWPDQLLVPALELGAGVAVIAALSLGGSVVLSSTANGIAVFMLFGAGLVAGLLGQIAEPEALNSETLATVSRSASWALPFEALYLSALSAVTADTVGFTRFADQPRPVRRRAELRRAARSVRARLRRRDRRRGAVGVPAARPLGRIAQRAMLRRVRRAAWRGGLPRGLAG